MSNRSCGKAFKGDFSDPEERGEVGKTGRFGSERFQQEGEKTGSPEENLNALGDADLV